MISTFLMLEGIVGPSVTGEIIDYSGFWNKQILSQDGTICYFIIVRPISIRSFNVVVLIQLPVSLASLFVKSKIMILRRKEWGRKIQKNPAIVFYQNA
jgi:hypothetical protein